MKTNHYQKPGIRWKINTINVAAILVLATMMMFMGQCVDNYNNNDITDNS